MQATALQALDFIPHGICIIDENYHIVFWNKQLSTWSQQQPNNVLKKNIMEMFPRLLQTQYRLRIDQVLDHGPPALFSTQLHHHLFDFACPDGSMQPHQVTITCIETEDKKTQALFTIQDMSQHVRQISTYQRLLADYEGGVQQRHGLKKQNAQLIAAIDQAAEAFIITRCTGEVEYVNAAFSEQTGWLASEVCQSMMYFKYQASGNLATAKDVQQILMDGLTWQGRRELFRQDGSTFTASISIAPILNEQGKVTHAVAIQEDIGEQIKLEEQYRKTQKQEALATLIGGIAHDFNNLLSGMLGHLYLAHRELEGLPKTAERIQKVQGVANEAAAIVQQLMTFARKDAVEKRQFPLDSFLKEFIKLAEHNIPKNIHLSIDFPHGSFPCQGDAERLQQTLMNIIQNAVDATRKSEKPAIRLQLQTFEAKQQQHWVERYPILKQGNYAQITIWDNGCGIAEDKIERIFDPFFTTKQLGSGLGLSVVVGNIKHNNGFIDVESNQDGTSFHIWLPLNSQAQKTNHGLDITPTQRSATILLVDDEEMVRETCTEILEVLGYQTLQAKDGIQAVDIVQQHGKKIDLILMDMVMPRMNGLTAAKNIRVLYPHLPIIFATAYDQTLSIKDTRDFTHSILIPKPFHPDILQENIEAFLSLSLHDD
ncbi:MAG: PAS domain S-box protein [Mariprofundaceae bacterium]|nr:PAS domain S-box protein [Mariprofundaceae bacterium]